MRVAHAVTGSLMYEPNVDWPVRSDVRTAAVLSVGWLDRRAVCWVARCRLMSALPCRCYARHTCSLYGGMWIEMPASFLSLQPCVSLACQIRLLLIIITTADVSVSAETHKPIYLFADTATLRVFTHRYPSNSNNYNVCVSGALACCAETT